MFLTEKCLHCWGESSLTLVSANRQVLTAERHPIQRCKALLLTCKEERELYCSMDEDFLFLFILCIKPG